MTISVKHAFNSPKTDGADSTVVQPSSWNAEHVFTTAAGKVLGRDSSGAGVLQELPLSFDPTGQSVLVPSGTTAQRPASPNPGMVRYNTTIATFEFWNGTEWYDVQHTTKYAAVAPTALYIGDLWYDTSVSNLKIWTGSVWAIAFSTANALLLAGGTMVGSIIMNGAEIIEAKGASVAAASSTPVFSTTNGNYTKITGINTVINDFGIIVQPGQRRKVVFVGGGNVIAVGTGIATFTGGSIKTQAGDTAELVADTLTQTFVVSYTRALGGSLVPDPVIPGGRLTLATNTPVMASDIAGAATVYYTPYLHGSIPIYDGFNWTTMPFPELSQTLSDTTKSPSATVASNPYDVFVWNDAGVMRATRGPSWLAGAVAGSVNARGTGAGSTELIRQNGVLANKNDITNGPKALTGVFVGSFATNAANTVDWVVAAAAAAGGNDLRANIWNMYNRVAISGTVLSSSNISTPGGIAPASSTANRITFFNGLVEEIIQAVYTASSTWAAAIALIGVNSTTVASGIYVPFDTSGYNVGGQCFRVATWNGYTGLGVGYIQCLSAGSTAYNAPQSGMVVTTKM